MYILEIADSNSCNQLLTTKYHEVVRLQVLKAASLKMVAFRDVAPCSLFEVERHFRRSYSLHLSVYIP